MKTISFLALFGLTVVAAQICPTPESLSPCTCFESNTTIQCMNIRGRFNLKQIFDLASSSVGDDAVFSTLTIQNTPVVEIAEDTFESWKFVNVDIRSNQHLVYISPKAFNASRNITENLVLAQNYIDNDAPYENDIFEFARSFENLLSVQITSSELSSIPDNAFANLKYLEMISLSYNRITQVGSKAFSGLSKLKTLLLRYNEISALPAGVFANLTLLEEIDLRYDPISHIGSKAFENTPSLNSIDLYSTSISGEGLDPEAFEGIGTNVGVDMTYNNQLSFMGQAPFKPLLDRARRVQVGGTSCSRNGCTYRYLYCDERVDWICDNLEMYEGKLSGYRCYSGLGMISDYCSNRIAH